MEAAETAKSTRPEWVKPVGDDAWQIIVRVQPGAKKNEPAGEMDGRLRLRITAQAVDNKANKALVAYVAKLLGLRPNRLAITAGETSRQKTLLITTTTEPNWGALRPPDAS